MDGGTLTFLPLMQLHMAASSDYSALMRASTLLSILPSAVKPRCEVLKSSYALSLLSLNNAESRLFMGESINLNSFTARQDQVTCPSGVHRRSTLISVTLSTSPEEHVYVSLVRTPRTALR